MRIKLSNKQKANFTEIITDCLIILGIILIFSPWLKDSIIGWQVQQTEIVQMEELPTRIAAEETIETPTVSSILKNNGNRVQEGYGVVSIPSVSLEQPILVGLTNQNLLRGGVAMYPERTLEKDNFVLFGHHLGIGEMLFGKLLDVKEHDQILVQYLEEEVAYEVDQIAIVDETEVSVLDNKEEALLTLITCPVPQSTKQRLVIRAKPVEEKKQETVRQQLKKDRKENAEFRKKDKKELSKKVKKFPIVVLLLSLTSIGLIRLLFYKKNKE